MEDQLKEAVARAENAERDVVRNENIVASVRNDLQQCKDKHALVDKEISKMDELVVGLTDDEPQPQQEAEPELGPEDDD